MDQSTNDKNKIDSLISNETSLIQQTQTIVKKRKKRINCSECNRKRVPLDESHQICHVCYKVKRLINLSGSKIIDDFIKYTQINCIDSRGKLEFVPHDRFKNIEFIAEGGFSKIYKAIWIGKSKNSKVVLKKLNNSKNITYKELNELKIFYDFSSKRSTNFYNGNDRDWYVSKYYGITQDPVTKDMMIIMPYYSSGDLIKYITKDFYSISWVDKVNALRTIIIGLKNIHSVKIVHRDLHSGNIFINHITQNRYDPSDLRIGDLGISKSATDSADDTDDNNENYGIIPYMAPEIFLGQKYTAASDIYSFGMIMWEVMAGRRPFWDQNHDTDLIIKIVDGLRPPIVTNAPKGYIELMEECWHSDPNQRPTAFEIYIKIDKMWSNEFYKINKTKIVESPDIGPVTINNPGAIYKSRPLSGMIHSAMSSISSRNQFTYKRKFVDNLIGDDNDQSDKRRKLSESKDNDYITRENEFEINTFNQLRNNEYTSREISFDI